MEFTGVNSNEKMQNKALKNVSDMLETWKAGKVSALFRKTHPSWKVQHTKDRLWMVDIEKYEIEKIDFFSDVIIDAFIRIFNKNGNNSVYRIRFLAEESPYKVNINSDYKFNPNSIRPV